MKLFGVIFIIACAILIPINKHFDYLPTPGNSTDPKHPGELFLNNVAWGRGSFEADTVAIFKDGKSVIPDTSYLWAYLVFTYFFTGKPLLWHQLFDLGNNPRLLPGMPCYSRLYLRIC